MAKSKTKDPQTADSMLLVAPSLSESVEPVSPRTLLAPDITSDGCESIDLPYFLLQKYYDPSSRAYRILVAHSERVAERALEIATNHPEWELNLPFIREAALLHDIGIYATDAPSIGCTGSEPYIKHGVIGAELLTREGLPRHALVCERHTGVGLTLEMIIKRNLPLPHREMIPVTLEEQIICFADCFYSKSGDPLAPKSVEQITKSLQKHGQDQVLRFQAWCKLFL